MKTELTPLEAIELLTDSVYYAVIECKENISTETKKSYLNAYNTIEKELKALEIIKKIVKIVDYSDHTIANGNFVILQGGEIKTREEYELLKEVLTNDHC